MDKVQKSYSTYSPKESVSVNSIFIKNYLIKLIPKVFQKISERNRNKNRFIYSVFDLKSKLNIEIEDYINRLIKSTYAEAGTVIYALSLIDKLSSTKKFFLSNENMHKSFLTALILSIKINEDKTYAEDQYIFASGVSPKELARLEYEFLVLLDYNLKIKDEDYHQYLSHCMKVSQL